jgi:hypothetical protein
LFAHINKNPSHAQPIAAKGKKRWLCKMNRGTLTIIVLRFLGPFSRRPFK